MSDERREAVFGWAAPPFGDQFPSMKKEAAAQFDKDNEAMIRLRMRGYLTDSQRDAVIKKITASVQMELAK